MPTKNNNLLEQLNSWYQTPLGRSVGKAVTDQLEPLLANLFGYHMLQWGLNSQHYWLDLSPIPHKILLTQYKTSISSLLAPPTLLPIATDSLDLILLPHVLEETKDSIGILSECYRTLIPDGKLVIIGFNPISWWGLAHTFMRLTRRAPWSGRFTSILGLRNLLMNQSFEIESVNTFFYRPPIACESIFNQLLFLETLGRLATPYPGGIYIIVAKKIITPMTPIRPIWSFRDLVIGKRLPEPTVSNPSRGSG